MTIEEIRKNAPKGATMYIIDGDELAYIKIEDGDVFLYMDFVKKWIKATPNKLLGNEKPLR